MTRIEIYAIALAGLLLSALAAGLYERHIGYQQAKSEAAAALLAADARAAELNGKLAEAANRSDQALENLRTQHAKDLSDALSSIKPVVVHNCPASGVTVSATAPARAGVDDSTTRPAQLPVPAERDIGAALVMLAGECQAERDQLIGWQDRQRELETVTSAAR
jgi:hypothetical protein